MFFSRLRRWAGRLWGLRRRRQALLLLARRRFCSASIVRLNCLFLVRNRSSRLQRACRSRIGNHPRMTRWARAAASSTSSTCLPESRTWISRIRGSCQSCQLISCCWGERVGNSQLRWRTLPQPASKCRLLLRLERCRCRWCSSHRLRQVLCLLGSSLIVFL